MSWLTITILAYFFLALVSLFDRYLLKGPIANAYAYIFYIGISWLFVAPFLIPLGINFFDIKFSSIAILAGSLRIPALLFLSKGIMKSEVSRIAPAIGGFLPIFTFLLFFFFLPQLESFNLFVLFSFFLLVLGSVLICLENSLKELLKFANLKYPTISAFFWALSFFLLKIAYLKLNFATGFFFTLIGGAFFSLLFLLPFEARKQILTQRINFRISGLFILGQAFGGIGFLFQNFAVFFSKTIPSSVD
jgi:drug/metabolite transporter (DMT)-like permease